MNYKELIEVTKNIIDETDEDEQIDVIIKSAINQGYLELAKVDQRPAISYIPVVRGMAVLPDDYETLISCEPALDKNDKKIGNTIITPKTGTLTVTYNTVRDALTKDNDEPDLNKTLHYAIVMYACYTYFNHRKKVDVASYYLNEFNTMKYNFETTQSIVDIPEEVVYYE